MNVEPFWFGFIVGTSVYALASGAAYILFLAGKNLVKFGTVLPRRNVRPRRALELA
jgi:hypothetical protein